MEDDGRNLACYEDMEAEARERAARLKEAINEALLNIDGISEEVARVRRRLQERLREIEDEE